MSCTTLALHHAAGAIASTSVVIAFTAVNCVTHWDCLNDSAPSGQNAGR